jgi:hypothetical protein
VGQEVLDRHVVVDQRQVLAQERAGRRGQAEVAGLDQADHGQGGEGLRSAGDAEAGVDRVRDAKSAVRPAVRLGELHPVAPVDAHHTGEPGRCSDRVDSALEVVHPRNRSRIR